MFRRRWRSSDLDRVDRSRPSKKTLPEVGSISRRISRPSVDLPEPDSPTSPSVSPATTCRLTAVTALTVSLFPPSNPADPAANSLVRFSVRTNALAAAVAALWTALDTDAGDILMWSLLLQRRIYFSAVRNHHRTSRIKSASGWRIHRVRNRSGNCLQAMAPVALNSRNRFE